MHRRPSGQHAIHSRIHETPWLRSLRPDPTCEIHTADAARLGIQEGDTVALTSPSGEIRMKVKLTHKAEPWRYYGNPWVYGGKCK